MINYCDSCGKCSKCGNCCSSLIPITRKEEKRIREYIKKIVLNQNIFLMMKTLIYNVVFMIEIIKDVKFKK